MPKKAKDSVAGGAGAGAAKGDNDFKHQLKELGEILDWFDAQEELDVEAALAKIKRASELVQASRKRLTEIENEFEEIKGEVEEE